MISRGSRYMRTAPTSDENGVTSFCVRDFHNFSAAKALYYTVNSSDTLDGIAFKQYGDETLMWAILDMNPQYNSELDIKPGDVIMIPAYDEVVRVSE